MSCGSHLYDHTSAQHQLRVRVNNSAKGTSYLSFSRCLKWHMRFSQHTWWLDAFSYTFSERKTFSCSSAQKKSISFHPQGLFSFQALTKKYLHLCTLVLLLSLFFWACRPPPIYEKLFEREWKPIQHFCRRCHLDPRFTDFHYKALAHCRLLGVQELSALTTVWSNHNYVRTCM